MEVNEHVVCLMDKYAEEGVCIGAIYNEVDTPDPGEAAGKFRKLFSDGTLIEYDKNAHKLTVDVKGQLEAIATGDVTIDTQTNLKGTAAIKATIEAPAIALTGNVVVSGSLEAAAISVAAGGSISMKDSSKLNIDGGITTTGEIDASDVKAGAVSLLTHVHPGVTSGPSLTGPGQ